MGKIFYIMGKSASGKDKIYSTLMQNDKLGLHPLVIYTTRPIRAGEEDGREYHFVDRDKLEEMRSQGRVIEERTYETVAGPWTYFTADDKDTDSEKFNYLAIGTLESYVKIRKYYGHSTVVPLYIEVNDENRLLRSIKRESKQDKPNYQEVCRRFLADCMDFSETCITEADITKRFDNNEDIEDCLQEVEDYILSML